VAPTHAGERRAEGDQRLGAVRRQHRRALQQGDRRRGVAERQPPPPGQAEQPGVVAKLGNRLRQQPGALPRLSQLQQRAAER